MPPEEGSLPWRAPRKRRPIGATSGRWRRSRPGHRKFLRSSCPSVTGRVVSSIFPESPLSLYHKPPRFLTFFGRVGLLHKRVQRLKVGLDPHVQDVIVGSPRNDQQF